MSASISPKTIRVTYKGQTYLIPLDFVMKDHPGGPDAILDLANQDITDAFEEAGHSSDAETMLQAWLEGISKERQAEILASQKRKNEEQAQRRIAQTKRWRQLNTAIAVSTAVAAAVGVAVYIVRRKQSA